MEKKTPSSPHKKSSKWAKRGKTQSVSLLKTHKNDMQWSCSLWIDSLAECCDNFMKNFVNEKFLIAKHTIVLCWLCWLLSVYSISIFCYLMSYCAHYCFLVLCSTNFTRCVCVKLFLGILLSSGVYFICNNDTKSLIKDRFLFIFAAVKHSLMQWRENKISEFHPWAISRKPRWPVRCTMQQIIAFLSFALCSSDGVFFSSVLSKDRYFGMWNKTWSTLTEKPATNQFYFIYFFVIFFHSLFPYRRHTICNMNNEHEGK